MNRATAIMGGDEDQAAAEINPTAAEMVADMKTHPIDFVEARDVYGRSPGMDALGDVRVLQAQTMQKELGIIRTELARAERSLASALADAKTLAAYAKSFAEGSMPLPFEIPHLIGLFERYGVFRADEPEAAHECEERMRKHALLTDGWQSQLRAWNAEIVGLKAQVIALTESRNSWRGAGLSLLVSMLLALVFVAAQ